MKVIPTLKVASLGVLAMFVAIFYSCKSDPVDIIPADADFVATFDAERLAAALDLSVSNGSIVFPEALSMVEDEMPDEVNEIAAVVWDAADFSKVTAFGEFKNDDLLAYVVVPVKDETKIENLVEEYGKNDIFINTDDGFRVYSIDGLPVMAISDGMAWFVIDSRDKENQKMVKSIKRTIKKAETNSFESVNAKLASVLASDNIANVVMNLKPIIKMVQYEARHDSEVALFLAMLSEYDDYWACVSSDLQDKEFSVSLNYMMPDGTLLKNTVAKEISTDFLAYLPSDFFFAGAIGLSQEAVERYIPNLEQYKDVIQREIGAELYNELLSFIRGIDGTISFAFGSSDIKEFFFRKFNAEKLQYIAMIEMKSGKALDAVNTMKSLLKEQNIPANIKEHPDGFVLNVDGIMFEVKADDDNLLFGNVDLKKRHEHVFGSAFDGKDIAIVGSLPTLSELSNGRCNMGVMTSVAVDDEALFKFSIVNSEQSFVESLFEIAMNMEQAERDYRRSLY